jgi:Bacterial PH domain
MSHEVRTRRFGRANRLFAGAVLGVVFGGMSVLLIVQTSQARAWVITGLGGVILVFSLWGSYAIMRTSVIVSPAGMTVRNTISTRRLAWSEVQGISPASADPMHYVRIMLTDGHVIRCAALAPTRFGGTRVLDRIAGELQQAIDELRPTG